MRHETLIQRCTVQLGVANRRIGTGFLVTPQHILTCEHVVRSLNSTIQVQRGQEVLCDTAKVIHTFPEYDVGILSFNTMRQDLPCIQFDDENPNINDQLYLFGYGEGTDSGDPVTVRVEGFTGDSPPFIKYKIGGIKPGMSGAALVNLRTGNVCGMSKYTMNRSSLEGGGGIPVSTLKNCLSLRFPQILEAQGYFHSNDNRWKNSSPLIPSYSPTTSSYAQPKLDTTKTSSLREEHYMYQIKVRKEQLSAVELDLETVMTSLNRIKLEKKATQLITEIENLEHKIEDIKGINIPETSIFTVNSSNSPSIRYSPILSHHQKTSNSDHNFSDSGNLKSPVILKSDRKVDYEVLQNLLREGRWREANDETEQVVLKAAKRQRDGWLNSQSIHKFPQNDLETIDNLWSVHSNNHFGFSIQKSILEEGDLQEEVFMERVNWQNAALFGGVTSSVETKRELDFTLNAPKGHLPMIFGGEHGWIFELLKIIPE